MNISAKGKKRICCGFLIVIVSISLVWHYMITINDTAFVSTLLFRNDKSTSTAENRTSVFSEQPPLFREPMSLHPSANKSEKSENISENKSEKSGQMVESYARKVVIMSSGRSGSSFLGDLFCKNPKVMYLFEPLRSVGVEPKDDAKSLEILQQIYSCDTVDDGYLEFLLKNKSFRKKSSDLDVRYSTVCKRSRRKKLCLGKLIQNACRRASSVVTKILTHRLPERGVWGIVKLLETNQNLRIIHLVRDPRRVINSMKAVGWFNNTNFSVQVRRVCDSVWNNTQYARTDAFFKGRYKLVVFREMIENPFTTVVKLYDFLKMGMVPNDVFSWIAENTRGSLRTKGATWGAYSTYRNSTAVLNKKVEFTEQESAVVNRYCSRIINFLENY